MAAGGTNLLPVGWGVTVGLTNQLVLPSNPTRTGLIFVCGGIVAIAICPATITPIASGTAPAGIGVSGGTPASPSSGVAAINGAGSITMQPGDKFIIDNLQCSCAWNGIAGGAGGLLTILEML
jgi:hypothetical protein